ncbi:MAG TPA: DUF4115 domain-containing protein [Povalibacter sp.]|uniref:RodZ domain-containing protein n=1 Tax=Povalibacter sp. TaxID=1962978 RepID=UPI002CADC092|nr:RodZ domain-containing protein [Povalibacter sp.]HMN43198.1 DUF4115 domain-containing protein [Povalibacter sp.]
MSMETGGAAQELNPEPAASNQSAPLTPGELLRTARAERNVSVQQIADDMHLDVPVVEALESNNFALLGPPVYSRGHLRKYAALVGLSPDVVISHYEMMNDVPIVPEPVPVSVTAPPPERRSQRVSLLVVAGIVVVVAGLSIVGWLANRPASESSRASESQAVNVAPAPEQDLPDDPGEPPPAEAEVEGNAPPAAAAPAAETPVANAGNDVTMRLRFLEPSWVEIYDATERRLMFGIGQAGQTSTLAGKPPLRVTLGLASAVSMEVNDRSVPVPRRAGKDAARFTVAADGSVR